MPLKALDDGELDSFDLERHIEAAFGNTLPDDETEHTFTVGQLHRLVLRKLGIAPPLGTCPSMAAFHRVCAALIDEFALNRTAVRPATSLRDLIGRPEPKRWNRVTTRLGIERHCLKRSLVTRMSIRAAALAIGLTATVAALSASAGLCAAASAGLFTLILARRAAIEATSALAVHVPFATVGDMTWAVLPSSFTQIFHQAWTPAQRDVWDRLAKLVARHYGTRPAELMPDTRFVGDLDLGDGLLAWLAAKRAAARRLTSP